MDTDARRAVARPSQSCRMCCLPRSESWVVDVGLALGHGPGYLARRFLNLKRHQIKHHHDACLGGDALLHEARRRGWLDESGAGSAREDPYRWEECAGEILAALKALRSENGEEQ